MRNGDAAVVRKCKTCAYYRHFSNGSRIALCLDKVSHFERLEGKDKQAAREILECAAQGHTKCNTTAGKQCGYGCCINSKRTYCDDYQRYSKNN